MKPKINPDRIRSNFRAKKATNFLGFSFSDASPLVGTLGNLGGLDKKLIEREISDARMTTMLWVAMRWANLFSGNSELFGV